MIFQKTILAILFALVAAYSVLVAATLRLDRNTSLCESPLIRKITPWSAACYYKALNQSNPSSEQLYFEHKMLDRFVSKNGVAAEVLKYRMQFYRKYQIHFRKNFQDIHRMYEDYTRQEHIDIYSQIEYLKFLEVNQLAPLAQQTLDGYCEQYVPKHRADVVEILAASVAKQNLNLSLKKCHLKVSKNI